MLIILFLSIQAFFLPYLLWLLFMAIAGRRRDEEFPQVEKRLRFAIIVCARNEERVIAKLIDSLKEQDYPSECSEVFLIAHNCTDNTAAIGRVHRAVVWELTQSEDPRKGDALKYAVDRIQMEYPDLFDAFCIFDADNIVDSRYLSEANSALQSGADGVVGLRDSINPDACWVSNMCSVHWLMLSRMYHMPRRWLGLSCFVQGTGYAFLKECMEPDGWKGRSLTEDFEFSANMILANRRVTHTLRARFYDEQPTEFYAWLGQLYRWMFGAKENTRFILSALGGIWSHPIRKWDLFWNASAIPVSGFLGLATGSVLTAGFFTGKWKLAALTAACVSAASYWGIALMALTSVLYCGKSIRRYWRGILAYPFFLFFASALFLLTLPYKKCQWKALLHKGNS